MLVNGSIYKLFIKQMFRSKMKQTIAGQMKRSILLFLIAVLMTLPVVFSQCTETIRDSASGIITSPFYPSPYPKDTQCTWTIRMHMGEGLRLTVDYLDNKEVSLTGSQGRCYDTLVMYQILSNGEKHTISSLCGLSVAELEQRTFDVTSPESGPVEVRIEFKSDYATQKTGFAISYTALCNQTIYASSGNLTSPWYPNYFPKNSKCLTKVVVPEGQRIALQFASFDIGNDNTICDDDYISMTTGDTDSNEYAILGDKEKYCGHEKPGKFITPSNEFSLLFVSDAMFQYPGFMLTWSIHVPTNTPQQTPTISTTTEPTTTSTISTTEPTSTTTLTIPETATTTILTTTTNGGSTKSILSSSVIASKFDPINILQMSSDKYNGTCSTTQRGFTCQYWNTNTPHRPNYVPDPDNHNYCRTPDNNSVTPWCYTTDPNQRWDDCDTVNCETEETTTADVTSRTLKNEIITTTSTILETTTTPLIISNTTQPSVIVAEETSKPSKTSWLPYFFIGLGICLIIIALFFVVRHKRKKREAPNADVVFHHLQTDENTYYDSRARENIYAEIPFLNEEEANLNARLRQQSPALPTRPASHESLDSVLLEKLRATEQDHRNRLQNPQQSTIEENCYAMASDVGCKTQVMPSTVASSSNRYRPDEGLQAEGNVSTTVQSTSASTKPPKFSKKKGLKSLFGSNNRKKSHDLESMFPDAIPASGAQTLPPDKSQGSTPNKTPVATPRKPKVAPRKVKPINQPSTDTDNVFTEETVGNHYASPLSFDQKFGFPSTSQPEESNYAIPEEPKLTVKPEIQNETESNEYKRKVPHSSFKVSIDPSIIDQGPKDEQENVDGFYASPTLPEPPAQNKNSIYDQPQSVRSNSDPETMNIEEGYCSMNDVTKVNYNGADLEPGVNLYTAMQPQGLHLDNVSYGL